MTMRRKTFDALLTSFGLVLAAILLVSGGLLTWSPTQELAQVTSPPATRRMATRTSPKLVSRASKVLRRIVIYFRESRPARIYVGLNGRDCPICRLNFGDGRHDRQVAIMDSSWLRAPS